MVMDCPDPALFDRDVWTVHGGTAALRRGLRQRAVTAFAFLGRPLAEFGLRVSVNYSGGCRIFPVLMLVIARHPPLVSLAVMKTST